MQEQEHPMTRQIVGLAMKVHRTLGSGFAESIYRNALIIELRKAEIAFVCHLALSVKYDGVEVGAFQADLVIGNQLIIELKAVDMLNTAHSAQLVNYLKATNIDHGQLLNFGTQRLEFKTKSRIYQPPDLHS